MATRGPKPKPDHLKVVSGTIQPCRATGRAVDEIEEEIKRPPWLTGRARKVWDEKIKKYESRNQNVSGCIEALAQYCSIEAALIDDFWKKKLVPPMAMINSYRIFAGEFFDTPASQHVRTPGGGGSSGNKFGKNKRQ